MSKPWFPTSTTPLTPGETYRAVHEIQLVGGDFLPIVDAGYLPPGSHYTVIDPCEPLHDWYCLRAVIRRVGWDGPALDGEFRLSLAANEQGEWMPDYEGLNEEMVTVEVPREMAERWLRDRIETDSDAGRRVAAVQRCVRRALSS